MNYWHRYKIIFLLVGTTLLLSGCGMKFVYRNLDIIIPWYVDDFTQLNREQEAQLDTLIRNQLDWHRTQQLPEYIRIIDKLLTLTQQPLTANEIEHLFFDIRKSYDQFLFNIEPAIKPLLSTLSPEQIKEVEAEFSDINDDFVEDHVQLSEKKYQKKRIKKFAKNFKKWFGRPDKHQKKILSDWVLALHRMDAMRHDFHLRWQKQFIAALFTNESTQKLSLLSRLLVDNEHFYSAEFKSNIKTNQSVSYQYMAKTLNSLSKKQKRRFERNLDDLKQDLQDLING